MAYFCKNAEGLLHIDSHHLSSHRAGLVIDNLRAAIDSLRKFEEGSVVGEI